MNRTARACSAPEATETFSERSRADGVTHGDMMTRRRFFSRALYTASIGAVASVVALEPRWLKVQKIRLGTGPVRHRFAQITDIHYRGDAAYLREVVAQVDALAPDFVCFTGDLIEEAEFVAPALGILCKLRAPLYGIPGNHDHWSRADFGPIRKAFAATGGAWLQDQQIAIRDGAVNLIGIDSRPVRVAADPSKFNLLMVHYPEWADRLGDLRCDLAIAGHSHGGQVRLPFAGALITPHNTGRYEMGLFDTPVGPLYVNPGIGTIHIDVRFNCRPEITLFEV